MKKLLSIILIFVFIYSIMGFFLNFEVEQFRIKAEVKAKILNNLPEKELTLIKISSRENKKLTWMEDDKEIMYNGNMFDIVRIQKFKDTTYYYCFNDEMERNILCNLDKLVKDQTENSKSRTSQKKQEINYFYHEALFSYSLTETPIVYFFPSTGNYSIIHEVLSPPPRITSIV